MAFAGLIFIGLLFGIMLSGIVVGFIVVRSGGPLKESLFGDAGSLPMFGPPKPAREPPPEADGRVNALQEELRIAQKLLDQGRVERDVAGKAGKLADEQIAALRDKLAEREARIQELEAAQREARDRADGLLAELSTRSEELSKVSVQLKDLRIEFDVSESGSSMATAQIDQLQRERDELAATVERLRGRRVASESFG